MKQEKYFGNIHNKYPNLIIFENKACWPEKALGRNLSRIGR